MDNLRIDSVQRTEPLTITVNGKQVNAYKGETLLAALIASGYKRLGRSSVLNEARSGLCGMGVCYECLVTVNSVPDVRACMTEVASGMEVLIDG